MNNTSSDDNKYDKIYNAVENFRQTACQILNMKKQLEDEVIECERAFTDINHCCEFNYPFDRKTKTAICKYNHEYGNRRRKAKFALEVIEPLCKHINSRKDFINEINSIANKMQEAKKNVEGSHNYKPRLLNDLFEKGQC